MFEPFCCLVYNTIFTLRMCSRVCVHFPSHDPAMLKMKTEASRGGKVREILSTLLNRTSTPWTGIYRMSQQFNQGACLSMVKYFLNIWVSISLYLVGSSKAEFVESFCDKKNFMIFFDVHRAIHEHRRLSPANFSPAEASLLYSYRH